MVKIHYRAVEKSLFVDYTAYMQYFALENPILLDVKGPHSKRYLNNRLTNNINILTPGQGCLAAALSPQGKTQGFFTVYCRAANQFLLTCDGGEGSKVVAALKQFLVADRVEVTDISASSKLLHCIAANNDFKSIITPPPIGDECSFTEEGERLIAWRKRSRQMGVDIILPTTRFNSFITVLRTNGAYQMSPTAQTVARISAGIPAFPSELNESMLFAEAQMSNATSTTKGCYVGQEVMAKIDALGRLPRILKVISIQGRCPLTAGESVYVGEKAIGEVMSSAYDDVNNITYCFADLKNDTAYENLTLTIKNLPGVVVSQ